MQLSHETNNINNKKEFEVETYSDILKDPSNNMLTIFLTYLDAGSRIFTFCLYLFYFLMVLLIPDLRRVSLIFVHNVNLTNFLFIAHYLFYINTLHPSFENAQLNHLLCSFSESVWAVLRYSRLFAVVLVSIYRWIAVNKINLYKKITVSYSALLAQIAFSWIASILLYITTKYLFGTTYGQVYCFDGYSKLALNSIKYYIVTSLLGTLLPTLFVIFIYVLITKKLMQISRNLKSITAANKRSSASTQSATFNSEVKIKDDNQPPLAQTTSDFILILKERLPIKTDLIQMPKAPQVKKILRKYMLKMDERKKRRETKFATQFLIINISVILSSITILIISIRNIVNLAPYFGRYYYLTQLVRILNIVSISVIPLVTLVYHKSFTDFMRKKFQLTKFNNENNRRNNFTSTVP